MARYSLIAKNIIDGTQTVLIPKKSLVEIDRFIYETFSDSEDVCKYFNISTNFELYVVYTYNKVTKYLNLLYKNNFKHNISTILNDINGSNAKAISLLKEKFPGRKVIASVIAYSNPKKISWADEIIYDLSPIEWLSMIQHADLVFTDSFHGTIFSMKFNVPFITYYAEERRKARFLELQAQFDISENIVSNLDQIKSFEPKYRNFDKQFMELSTFGRTFLKEALG